MDWLSLAVSRNSREVDDFSTNIHFMDFDLNVESEFLLKHIELPI